VVFFVYANELEPAALRAAGFFGKNPFPAGWLQGVRLKLGCLIECRNTGMVDQQS
jgi:hypothetical protein